MTELRRPALLDQRRHDRKGFDSGEQALDEWLRRYAGQNRRRDTAATWVRARVVLLEREKVATSRECMGIRAHRSRNSL